MRALVLACVAAALTGCVGDQAMNYGTPQPVASAPAVLPALHPYNPPGLAPMPETPRVMPSGVLPPLRPYSPPGTTPFADPQPTVGPGVLPPLKQYYLPN